MKLREDEFILSIETAFAGGSLALTGARGWIESWRGCIGTSKADEVLEQLERILIRKGVARKQIKYIAVSEGAGSATGEKIGLAVAKGLAKSLKCRLLKVSVFESLLAELVEPADGEYLVAVTAGKNNYNVQRFTYKSNAPQKKDLKPVLCAADDLTGRVRTELYNEVIISNPNGGDNFEYDKTAVHRVTIKSESLAEVIGKRILKSTIIASDNELNLLCL